MRDFELLFKKKLRRYSFDLRSLGLFRISLGALLIVNLFSRFSNLREHYTSEGILTQENIESIFGAGHRFSQTFFYISDSYWFVVLLFALAFGSYLMFCIGYRTKLFQVASILFLASFNYNFGLGRSGSDVLMQIALIWGLLLPLGARFAVRPNKAQKSNEYMSFAVIFYLVQIMSIYLISHYSKASEEWRVSKEALSILLELDYLTTGLGKYMRDFPAILKVFTSAVMVIEFYVPIMLILPVFVSKMRYYAIFLLLLLHVGILLFIRVGLFPVASLVVLIPLLPSSLWDINSVKYSVSKIDDVYRYLNSKRPKLFLVGAPLISRFSGSSSDRMLTRIGRVKQFSAIYTFLILIFFAFCFLPYINKRGRGLYEDNLSTRLVEGVGLEQGWRLFSPGINKEDPWIVVEATAVNGDKVDIWRYYWSEKQSSEVEYENIGQLFDANIDNYWQVFLEHLYFAKIDVGQTNFVNFLCQNWLSEGNLNLKEIEVNIVSEFYPENEIKIVNVHKTDSCTR